MCNRPKCVSNDDMSFSIFFYPQHFIRIDKQVFVEPVILWVNKFGIRLYFVFFSLFLYSHSFLSLIDWLSTCNATFPLMFVGKHFSKLSLTISEPLHKSTHTMFVNHSLVFDHLLLPSFFSCDVFFVWHFLGYTYRKAEWKKERGRMKNETNGWHWPMYSGLYRGKGLTLVARFQLISADQKKYKMPLYYQWKSEMEEKENEYFLINKNVILNLSMVHLVLSTKIERRKKVGNRQAVWVNLRK